MVLALRAITRIQIGPASLAFPTVCPAPAPTSARLALLGTISNQDSAVLPTNVLTTVMFALILSLA